MAHGLRLLWVTPFLPRCGVTASRERWWQLLARLATRHAITLLCLVDEDDAARLADAPPGLAAIDAVPRRPWRPDDPLALLPRTVAGGYCDPAFRDAIARRLDAERYDVVQYELSEMANFIPRPARRSLLTVHQISFAQEGPLRAAEGGGIAHAAVLLHRYLRELDFELRAVRAVDGVVTMSEEDRARLLRFAPDLDVAVSPCGIDPAALRLPSDLSPPTTDVVFVGNFIHPPNVDAARFLVREVLPRVGRALRVRIVGHAPPTEVRALESAAVVVTGGVADVAPELIAARVCVAPVRFGTGMHGKVLHALALGRPVVTTPLGIEGLGAVHGRHLLVADDAAAMAAAVRRVLDDPTAAADLGRAGRALVASRFDWDSIAAAHERIYDDTLRRPARAVPRPTRASALETLGPKLGRWPAIGAGFALLAGRAVRWHGRRLIGSAHARHATLDGRRTSMDEPGC